MADRLLLGPLSRDGRRRLEAAFGRLQAELEESIWQTALRKRVIRPEDLLVLDFQFSNLRPVGDDDRRLVRRDGGRPARLIVRYPPQAIGEQAYRVEPPDPTPALPFTAASRLSGASRVVVEMPAEVAGLDWSLEAFLKALGTWPLALDWAARPDPRGRFLGDVDILALADQLGAYAAHVQARAGLSPADSASLRRSAVRLGAFMRDPGRAGRPPPAAEIGPIFDSELDRTLAGSRPNRARREAASQLLALATAERIVRDVAGLRPARDRPRWEIVEPLLPFLMAPHPPGPAVTALEIPWRVIQSPLATAGFAHATAPVTHDGRTELWHSRLGRRGPGGVDDDRSEPLRALWSPDYGAPQADEFITSSTAEQRHLLVRATAGYDEVADGLPTPLPGDARRLILTALGAQLDYLGTWRVNGQQPLESWTHHAALGRDYYVRIVEAGFLFPLGHRAVKVDITERKFETRPGGGRVALLRKKTFIIVREPVRSYPSAGMPDNGRGFPFTAVEILTRETPPVEQSPPGKPNWWPLVGGDDFLFDCVGFDQAGQPISFSMPLAFIRIDRNGSAHGAFNDIVGPYNSGADGRAKRPLNGARVAFGPVVGGAAAADTRQPTESLTFRGIPVSLAADGLPDFYPDMAEAEVVTGAMQALTGLRRTAHVTFPSLYRAQGFGGANRGQVYLEAEADPLVFGASGAGADKVGGLATPDLTPGAFSRTFGVVGGAAGTFAGGRFDPAVFFPDAKLLGVLPLRDVLHEVLDIVADAAQTPKFDQVELPDRVVTELRLSQTGLKAALVFEPNVGGQSRLDLSAKTTVLREGGASDTRVEGALTHFRINLFGFILLNVDRLRFLAEPGRKTEVDVDLDPQNGVVFGGPLAFVNTLRDVIPGNGFSDPPDLAVSPSGVTASYSLALPTIQVGVLSLQNVSLGAGFSLPFTGESPSVRFNFAERHNPFNLTVSLFGGGGFFLIGVDTGGVREIEAALEFGAQIAIDLGVASGRVYVKAGIYFHWREAPDKLVELEGYVEMGGELSVLGLISVSLTFHLSLAYRKTGGQAEVRGQAQLVVEVEVLFFSASVTVKVERSFAGAPGDPPFLQFVPNEAAWRNYCAAYA